MTGVLSITDADLAPIRPLLIPLNSGVDLTRLGSWCILPLCCGAIAAQSVSRQMDVIESIQPYQEALRLIAGEMPPDVLASEFARLLREWADDPVGARLATQRLREVYRQKGQVDAPIAPARLRYFSLAILMNSYKDLDTDDFMPIRAWADGSADRWLELSFAAGLLMSADDGFAWHHLATSEISMRAHPERQHVKALFESYKVER